MGRSSRVLQHWNPKSWFFFSKKFEIEFGPYPKKRNRPGFFDISPTLVIDTSMERSSQVLHHGNPKSLIFCQKGRNWLNWILSVPREKKLPWLRQFWLYPVKRNRPGFVDISPTLVIDTSMERSLRVLQHGNTKLWIVFKKVRNWILTCILTCAKELKLFK